MEEISELGLDVFLLTEVLDEFSKFEGDFFVLGRLNDEFLEKIQHSRVGDRPDSDILTNIGHSRQKYGVLEGVKQHFDQNVGDLGILEDFHQEIVGRHEYLLIYECLDDNVLEEGLGYVVEGLVDL